MWRRLSYLALLFLTKPAMAESIDLVCTAANGFSIVFEIDTDQNSIKSNGRLASKVNITKNDFTFILNTGKEDWFHTINRTTGILQVYSPTKSLDSSYSCIRAKPQF